MAKRSFLFLFILISCVLFAVLPLFRSGFIPTHDGEYHIIRFAEFYRMVSSGYLFPRWAPTLNSGYGLPLFIFHYPFPNYIGVILHALDINFVESFKVANAVGYILASVFCFLWLRKLFGNYSALVGTVVSAFVPYWFVDIYVRGSIGEVWALCFLFLSFAAIEYNATILLLFATFGLILSHNILAFIFAPFIIGYILLRSRKFIFWWVLGICLAAYFWLPALFEQKFVVGLNTVNFREHFPQIYELLIPSWGTDFSGSGGVGNKMSFQVGIVPLFVIMGAAFFSRKQNKWRSMVLYFMYVFVIAIVLMLPFSLPIWNSLPILQFLQYPWRLLSYVIPVVAVCAAFLTFKYPKHWFGIGLILGAIVLSYSYTRPVVYAPRDDAYYLSRRNFTDGTSSLGDSFSTIWTGWKRERSQKMIEVRTGIGDIIVSKDAYLYKEFVVDAITPLTFVVNTLYYPGWFVTSDGENVPINYANEGIIEFHLSPGKHSIVVDFRETPFRKIADSLSISSLVIISLLGILQIYAYRHRHNIA